jgi:type IV pilus assembly protein PilE
MAPAALTRMMRTHDTSGRSGHDTIRAMANHRGFTMIELLLALTIAALLLGLAIPSYRHYVQRAHRAEAAARLLQLSLCQERLRASEGRYRAGHCLPADTRRYAFELQLTGSPVGQRYRAQARPRGPQENDPCGTLIIEHTGLRRVSGGADIRRCWSGG